MNYFPFHIGDYAAHTAHLEPMEDLAYRRLLDLYYLREGALPADVTVTAKLIRMRSMVADVESVLKEFFELTEEGWVHGRCDVEIEAMQEKQQKQRDKANKRWHKPDAEQGNATAQKNNATADAAAPNSDAVAMPPTPTPTPTPKNEDYCSDLLAESKPESLTSFAIPLNDSTEYRIPERDFDEWEVAYPAVDVAQELRQIRAWSLANKAKRKTKTGVNRFIVAWLSKAQDNPRSPRRFDGQGDGIGVFT